MPEEILSGWKDIARYLGKGVRTVQRYERGLGLPVRRPTGKSTGSVIATKAELCAWILASPIREDLRLSQPARDNAGLLNEFTQNVEKLQRLGEETKGLRQQLLGSLALLRASISSILPAQAHVSASQRRMLSDVLTFDAARKNAP